MRIGLAHVCERRAVTGLETAQGLLLTESFYWDLNDSTRAWTKTVVAQSPNNWPGMSHAGSYAATLHYLKTVADMGVAEAKKDGVATVNRMKAMPFNDDPEAGTGRIREDGRVLVPAYLFEVKKPSESATAWDCYKLRATRCPAIRHFGRWPTDTALSLNFRPGSKL